MICKRCSNPIAVETAHETGELCAACTHASSAGDNASAPLRPGTSFLGMEVLDELGHGGMGVVYRAHHPALRRTIALKILSPSLTTEQEFVQRFLREAKAMTMLRHPNLVPVFDFGKKDDLFWLVMEYVEGTSLRPFIDRGALPERKAIEYMLPICDGLEYAHANGIIHRDIKPENILVDREGHVKVADFGLAKLMHAAFTEPALTRSDIVIGTPQYMAPEQFDNMKFADQRADIYSCGVILYELLTGKTPIGKVVPPSRRAAVDPRLDAIVLKSLEKAPELRYQKIREFRQALAGYERLPRTWWEKFTRAMSGSR